MPNVLLVDNDESFVKSLKAGLKVASNEFTPLIATTGKQAVQMIRSDFVDLIVTELEMPAVDGFELLNYATRHFPSIPVIAISGDKTDQAEAKARDLGACAFFVKPPDIKELAQTISKELGQGAKEGFIKNISVGGFIQLIHMEEKTCLLGITNENKKQKGLLYLENGILYDAVVDGMTGEKAALQIIGWEKTKIQFYRLPKKKIKKRIQTELIALLMEATRLKDEAAFEEENQSEESVVSEPVKASFEEHTPPPKVDPASPQSVAIPNESSVTARELAPKKQKSSPPVERLEISPSKEKTSTHLLHEITDTPGVDAALIVARDGFVIESAGTLGAIDLDTIGASVALSMNGAASVEKEIGLKAFQSFTWEASDALIMCTVAGDALLVVIAPDSGKIGRIRLTLKKHLPDLAKMF